jgi:primosomal protein N' (replication factor Y)
VGLVRFVALGTTEAAAAARAGRVAEWLRRASAERLGGALTVLGPAACPIARLHGRWRWHVLAKAAERRALGRVMRAWRAQGRATAAVVADRDPVMLL